MSNLEFDLMRNQETPTVFGLELNGETLTPIRTKVDTSRPGDYGADPLGDVGFLKIPFDPALRTCNLAVRRSKWQRLNSLGR